MEIYSQLLVGAAAAILGVLGTLITSRYRENISSKKEQLKYFYSPLEILIRMNKKAFKRHSKQGASTHDKEYIEKNIWYPNHLKTKEIIMEQSHHLNTIPDEILDLLEHINVWLSEYELIHKKKEKSGPVYAGPKGYDYPEHADKFIEDTSAALRKKLSKK